MSFNINKIFILIILTTLLSCVSDISDNTGTGHDGEMKVLGSVYTKQGKPAANLNVRILPVTFNPIKDTLDKIQNEYTTDLNGNYEFLLKDSGYFTISAYDSISNSYLYRDSIPVSNELENQGADTLKSANVLTVINEQTDSINGSSFIIYLLGTDLVFDTIINDTSIIYIPSDTVNVKVSNIVNPDSLIHDNSIIPDDSLSNKIIIKDTSTFIPGILKISTPGQVGNVWEVFLEDTLLSYVEYIDTINDSISILNYSISYKINDTTDSKLINSDMFQYVPTNLYDTLTLIGFVNVVYYESGISIDTIKIQSDSVSVITSYNIPKFYININGPDTIKLNDSAAYQINSNLDSVDNTVYKVIYKEIIKKPMDTSFVESNYNISNIFTLYFDEIGKYEFLIRAEVVLVDTVNLVYDTFSVYSDTMSAYSISSNFIGTINISSSNLNPEVNENIQFHISFKDTLGDTIYSPSFLYNFSYSDGYTSDWTDTAIDFHSFSTKGKHYVIGSLIIDSVQALHDTIFFTVNDSSINDTTDLDSLFPNTPEVPTGSDVINISNSRYFVTNGDDMILNGDTLRHEYRFIWDDTLTDSLFSPDKNQPNASSWDTLPYAEHSWDTSGIYFVRVQKRFELYPDKISNWSDALYVKVFKDQNDTLIGSDDFSVPLRPVGDDTLAINQEGTFITQGASCKIPGPVQYRFDWGDGTISEWSNNSYAQHKWDQLDEFLVRSQARSVTDTAALSNWSVSLPVLINTTGRLKK